MGRSHEHVGPVWWVALTLVLVSLTGIPRAVAQGAGTGTGASTPPPATPERVAFLADRLKADDPRVRTQAALALGTANNDIAISPLCQHIDDGQDVVRQAVAVALKRLNRTASLDCLRARFEVERVDGVRLQLTRAIDAIEAGGVGPAGGGADPSAGPPKDVPDAKFYVSISPITNATTRAQGEVEKVVGGAIREKLDGLGRYQVAPAKETNEAAKQVIGKRKLKGYYLAVSLERFDYSGGNLRVRIKVAVFTYPGKDLRGEVPSSLTQTGVAEGDHSAEDNLMGLAAGRAIELFAQNFQ